jgi:hypothetical protein
MSELIKRITREELYERIWTTPIVKLAKELGFSYVEIVRICAAWDVPRPTVGYWYRLQHGGVSEREPLPLPPPGATTESELGNRAGVDRQGRAAPPTMSQDTRDQKDEPRSEIRTRGKVAYSRQQLYEAIWSTPCQVLAKCLGISDVALAKTCKRLGIPRPSRGHWAKVAAGQKMPKTSLPPPLDGQDRVLTFDVSTNSARREEASEFYRSQREWEHLAVEMVLPDVQTPLHSLAERHRVALEKVKAENDGFVRLNRKDLFHCQVAQTSITRLSRALHALIVELQARGYRFRASAEQYGNLDIIKGADSLTLRCLEVKEQLEREPTEADKRRPSWTWQLKETRATGKLSFEVHARGLRGRRAWAETGSRPLEEVLGIVAEKVDIVFQGFEAQRRREAEEKQRREEAAKQWERERAEEEKRRAQEEKRARERERLKRHETKLNEIEAARRHNLVLAAEQWIASQQVTAFVEACEARWRAACQGRISEPQTEWLTWAKAKATRLNPLTRGYPDPGQDGPFDRGTVAVGGPYPSTRVMEEGPTEPDLANVKGPPAEQPQAPGGNTMWHWGLKS